MEKLVKPQGFLFEVISIRMHFRRFLYELISHI